MIVIRHTAGGDGDRLKQIRLEALADEPDAYGSTLLESLAYPDEHWERDVLERPYFLALDEGRVVGMASGGKFPPHPEARWLYGMYVTPTHRGTGLAERIVHAVAEWARAEHVTTLGLHVTNTLSRSVAFYVKLGFTPIGEPAPMDRDPHLHLQTMVTDLRTNARI